MTCTDRRVYIQRNREPLGRFAAILMTVIFVVLLPVLIGLNDRSAAERNRGEFIKKKYIHEIMAEGSISEEVLGKLDAELAGLRTNCYSEITIGYPAVYLNEAEGRREIVEIRLNDREIRDKIKEGPLILPQGTAVGIRLVEQRK